MITGPEFVIEVLASIGFLRIFGVPISWRKARGGRIIPWIGYELNLREYTLGITEKRADWMIGWFTKILDQGVLLIRELREALGRMIFVYGALQWDRPFLGPLFGLLSHHQPGECIQIPLFVRTIFDWLRSRLRQRRSYPCHLKRSRLGALMRVDARADGDAVAVGGWRRHGTRTGTLTIAGPRGSQWS